MKKILTLVGMMIAIQAAAAPNASALDCRLTCAHHNFPIPGWRGYGWTPRTECIKRCEAAKKNGAASNFSEENSSQITEEKAPIDSSSPESGAE